MRFRISPWYDRFDRDELGLDPEEDQEECEGDEEDEEEEEEEL